MCCTSGGERDEGAAGQRVAAVDGERCERPGELLLHRLALFLRRLAERHRERARSVDRRLHIVDDVPVPETHRPVLDPADREAGSLEPRA